MNAELLYLLFLCAAVTNFKCTTHSFENYWHIIIYKQSFEHRAPLKQNVCPWNAVHLSFVL